MEDLTLAHGPTQKQIEELLELIRFRSQKKEFGKSGRSIYRVAYCGDGL